MMEANLVDVDRQEPLPLDPELLEARLGCDDHCLQGRIEESRVNLVGISRGRKLTESNFRDHLVLALPELLDALEGRPVIKPPDAELLVDVVVAQLDRTALLQLHEVAPLVRHVRHAELAVGLECPLPLPAVPIAVDFEAERVAVDRDLNEGRVA